MKEKKKLFLPISLMLIGAIAIVFSVLCFTNNFFVIGNSGANTVAKQYYNGDAYTGMQNAMAVTTWNLAVINENILSISETFLKTTSLFSGATLLITGLTFILIGVKKILNNKNCKEKEVVKETTESNI